MTKQAEQIVNVLAEVVSDEGASLKQHHGHAAFAAAPGRIIFEARAARTAAGSFRPTSVRVSAFEWSSPWHVFECWLLISECWSSEG
jgi:hypothetical protein